MAIADWHHHGKYRFDGDFVGNNLSIRILNSMSGQFEYYGELQLNDGSLVTIDLEERGWAEPERLRKTRVFTLIPKDPTSRWPFVRVHIPKGAKPIFKSRNNVRFMGPQSNMNVPIFRAYAIGWHRGKTSHWTWVFPNGSIESGTDTPSFNDILVEAVNERIKQEMKAQEDQQAAAESAAESEGMNANRIS